MVERRLGPVVAGVPIGGTFEVIHARRGTVTDVLVWGTDNKG